MGGRKRFLYGRESHPASMTFDCGLGGIVPVAERERRASDRRRRSVKRRIEADRTRAIGEIERSEATDRRCGMTTAAQV